jgi:hypothetical protein
MKRNVKQRQDVFDKAAQKEAQHTLAVIGNCGKSAETPSEKGSKLPSPSEGCGLLQTAGMGAPGFEPGTKGL